MFCTSQEIDLENRLRNDLSVYILYIGDIKPNWSHPFRLPWCRLWDSYAREVKYFLWISISHLV